MPRALPLQLYEPEAISRDGKKEIEARKSSELRIGDDNYIMPSQLDGDVIAIREWNRVTSLYKEANLRITSSADVNIIARYCLLYSEITYLQRKQPTMPKVVEKTISLHGLVKVKETEKFLSWKLRDQAIMKKMEMLLKLEDRLFLNPLAKFKNIPMIVKKDDKQTELEALGLGTV